MRRGLMLVGALAFASAAACATPDTAVKAADPDSRVVWQGGSTLRFADIDARVSRIPADKRAGFMNDPERIEQLLRDMLLAKQMAKEAADLGIDEDPVVKADIAYARDEILAKRRVSVLMQKLETPDFDALASERYVSSPELYRSPETLDLRHILISRGLHGEAAAREIAEKVHQEWLTTGGDFVQYVGKYSEEQNADADGGLLEGIRRGQTAPDFEAAAFALAKPGDVSPVVRTKFGYHIIRLEKRTSSERYPYETAKPQILDELKKEFVARTRKEFIDRTRSTALDADPDLVQSLRTRYLPGGDGTKAIERVTSQHDETGVTPVEGVKPADAGSPEG